jgi:hypothetical protein
MRTLAVCICLILVAAAGFGAVYNHHSTPTTQTVHHGFTCPPGSGNYNPASGCTVFPGGSGSALGSGNALGGP